MDCRRLISHAAWYNELYNSNPSNIPTFTTNNSQDSKIHSTKAQQTALANPHIIIYFIQCRYFQTQFYFFYQLLPPSTHVAKLQQVVSSPVLPGICVFIPARIGAYNYNRQYTLTDSLNPNAAYVYHVLHRPLLAKKKDGMRLPYVFVWIYTIFDV